MAKVACGECGASVSASALACPACGHPRRQLRANPVAAVVVMLVCLGAFAYVADDMARRYGVFALPFGALGAVLVAAAIIRRLPRA